VSRLKRVKRESSRKRESLHFQTFAEQTARVPKKQFFSLTSRNAIETNSASAILCLLLTTLVSLRHRQISPNRILLCALRTLPTNCELCRRQPKAPVACGSWQSFLSHLKVCFIFCSPELFYCFLFAERLRRHRAPVRHVLDAIFCLFAFDFVKSGGLF